jgi:hypothetical protein
MDNRPAQRRAQPSRADPIPPELVELLRNHFARQSGERHAAGDAWDDRDPVWCGPECQPIDPHDDWEEWRALLAEAGIKKTPGCAMRWQLIMQIAMSRRS